MRKRNLFYSVCLILLALLGTACGKIVPDEAEVSGGLEDSRHNRRADLLGVTASFGKAVVVEAGSLSAEASRRPWSAYWIPANSSYLFSDDKSPLQKYDKYSSKAHNVNSTAADFERDNIFDEYASGWSGHLGAWALASILEPEPTSEIKLKGVNFSVGDQKALILKAYESAHGETVFGERFGSNPERRTEEDLEDIYPDQFHRFLQAVLFEKKQAFIMDYDAADGVWYAPIYQAQMTIRKDSRDARVMHVDLTLKGAAHLESPSDFVGTQERTFNYTYDLYGQPTADGGIEVDFGIWTGRSEKDHPDFVSYVVNPTQVTPGSRNRYLDIKVVQEILKGR